MSSPACKPSTYLIVTADASPAPLPAVAPPPLAGRARFAISQTAPPGATRRATGHPDRTTERRYCPWMTFWDGLVAWLATGTPPTYMAVVVASVAAVFAYRSSSASRESAETAAKQLKRLQDERESEQASMVAVWIVLLNTLNYTESSSATSMERKPYYNAFSLRYEFRNASVVPIYNALVYGKTNVGLYAVGFARLVAPNAGGKTLVMTDIVAKGALNQDSIRLGVLFTDAQGFHWDRQPSGMLVRMTEEMSDQKRAEIMADTEGVRTIPALTPQLLGGLCQMTFS